MIEKQELLERLLMRVLKRCETLLVEGVKGLREEMVC